MLADPAAPFVQLQALSHRYRGGTQALAGLDLQLARGSFVSLLGPSGCGKSTVLRLLAGLDAPSAGRVVWAGRPDATAPRIGCVFQDPTLMPWRRVAANVALPLELAGLPRTERDARVQAALAGVGLASFAHHHPHQLSGGMRMRVSLARAWVTRPEMLLLDEPFGALDEITRFALQQDLLAQWAERRCTTVFVTHSIGEAVFLSQRVVVMSPRPGRVWAELEVPFGWPREPGLRHQPEFATVCGQVAHCLQQAATGQDAPAGPVGASTPATQPWA